LKFEKVETFKESLFHYLIDKSIYAQTMLPEAVAIVIAPYDRTRRFGAFQLTEQGLRIVQQCQRRGFHHHNVPYGQELYTDALARFSKQRRLEVEDLRR